ncbi:hypothetical protein RRG08_010731 [Elysia crispata]|uniref:Uncharacterized protein n=1 Tax=Elysia crispata TaxID=231223 RepID=A0AAE1ADR5_9GAST|nr:hypothetical protein RRG08_010731 [Elysia crispata]
MPQEKNHIYLKYHHLTPVLYLPSPFRLLILFQAHMPLTSKTSDRFFPDKIRSNHHHRLNKPRKFDLLTSLVHADVTVNCLPVLSSP